MMGLTIALAVLAGVQATRLALSVVLVAADRRAAFASLLSAEDAFDELRERDAVLRCLGFSPRERERLLRRVYGGGVLRGLKAVWARPSGRCYAPARPADPQEPREPDDE